MQRTSKERKAEAIAAETPNPPLKPGDPLAWIDHPDGNGKVYREVTKRVPFPDNDKSGREGVQEGKCSITRATFDAGRAARTAAFCC